ncbi:MAG TPA: TolC family protein [Gemmataceae bacterium]|nr:TolC family protein [Gemmataceae bacterium]
MPLLTSPVTSVRLFAVLSLGLLTGTALADTMPNMLTREAAVRWGLQNNPELAAIRQQHGISAAAVIIAETYPFNPVWEAKVRAASGPTSAGISNRVSNEHKLLMDVEVRHQGQYRRQAAGAALTRTDWEIAFQELSLAVRILRTFDAVIYQQNKLQLVEDTLRLNEAAAKDVSLLAQQGKLRAIDLILIRTEVNDIRGQLGPARVAYEKAWHELRRALGVADGNFTVQGTLEVSHAPDDTAALLATALEQRPDLHARQAAGAEAEARVRLALADRYGNPNVGPAYEYDPTRINLIGAQFTVPLPVLNTHRGEICQRVAERTRAALELRQAEVTIQQDLAAAQARLSAARHWVETYRTELLPELQKSLESTQKLFAAGEPSVDVLRILDVRRKLLKARDGYLDALYELRQARDDLSAAVGDLALAMDPEPESPSP